MSSSDICAVSKLASAFSGTSMFDGLRLDEGANLQSWWDTQPAGMLVIDGV